MADLRMFKTFESILPSLSISLSIFSFSFSFFFFENIDEGTENRLNVDINLIPVIGIDL